MKKQLLVSWIFMVTLGYANGQQPVNSQQSGTADFRHLPQAQLSILTDREVYLAGETIWLQLLSTVADAGEIQDGSKIAYVEILDAQHKPVFQEKIGMKNGSANGYLKLPTNLSTGNYTICAYTNWMKNFGEDCFLRKQIVLINSFQPLPLVSNSVYPVKVIPLVPAITNAAGLFAKTSKTVFRKREKVIVNLETTDTLVDNLTVTVIKTDKLSDWRMDSKISTSTEKSVPSFKFPPEINGQLLKGKVWRKDGQPLANAQLFITIPGKNPRLYAIESDKDGNIDLEIPLLNGNVDLIIQPLPKDSAAKIVVYSPFFEHSMEKKILLEEVRIDADLMADIRQRHKSLQVQEAYYSDSTLARLNAQAMDSTLFFAKADERFNLDDYTRFTTMEEVFREYVSTVMVRKHEDGFHLLVLDKGLITPKFFDADPFLMLDGVPLFNFKKFFKFDPFKVKKGAVVAHRYFYNHLKADGILSLQTYNGDLDGYPLEPYVTVHSFNGIQVPRIPFSPQQVLSPNLPDQRCLIYYAPEVSLNKGLATVEFYTSDVPGTYKIGVQNLNKRKPMNTTLEIKVE